MADTLRNWINDYRQRLDSKIKSLAAALQPAPAPEKLKYPENAVPVLTALGETYMHVWLDNDSTPPQTCVRLRNGFLIKLDQRITQAFAVALLKLPYKTDAGNP
jgi:hypothetical protein